MWILHASITEYVIIFGTPIGTVGHTGRWYITLLTIDHIYFISDTGLMITSLSWTVNKKLSMLVTWQRKLISLVKCTIYQEVIDITSDDGLTFHSGQSQIYRIPERAWALEYARGWIPAMLPFGIVEIFTR